MPDPLCCLISSSVLYSILRSVDALISASLMNHCIFMMN